MASIRHQIAIRAPLEKVYAALSSPEAVSKWWDKQTETRAPCGTVWSHDPGPQHGRVDLLLWDMTPTQRVEWECISEHPSTSPASAWTGTHIKFELTSAESPAAILMSGGEKTAAYTTVNFEQTNYDENSPYFGFNNWAWAQVLNGLKSYCES
jgi:uncharacterized protein YndB with AHSA1/START domain